MNNQSNQVEHPDSSIRLMDSRVIPAYRLMLTRDEEIDNSLSLDTDAISRRKRFLQLRDKTRESLRQRSLFYEHAWLFIVNAEKILNDSRMFLAPIPFTNGLAYTGVGGFRKPTLGIYVEWWTQFHKASHTKDGMPLVYLAGSPLSGANACVCSDCDGKTKTVQINHFAAAWQSFMRLNTRYDSIKLLYQAYTLDEVIAKLTTTEDDTINRYVNQLKKKIKQEQEEQYHLREVIFDLQRAEERAHRREIHLIIHLNYEEVSRFLTDRECLIKEYNRFSNAYYLQRCEQRKLKRMGELTHEGYEVVMTPLREKRKEMRNKISEFEKKFVKDIQLRYGIFTDVDEIEEAYNEPKEMI